MHSADPRARNILFGLLVKLVITSPCHGEDHGFKSRRGHSPSIGDINIGAGRYEDSVSP